MTAGDGRIISLSSGCIPRPAEAAQHFPTVHTPNNPYSDRQYLLKLSVSRETFLARLGVAVRGASTRGPVPSLAGVLLRVEDGRAELQATDMELGVRVSLEVGDSTPGQAVVPGRLLLDVVRSLPKDDLTLEYRSAEQDVEVVSGPSKFHLRTLPTEDFPKLPEPPTDDTPDGAGRRLRGPIARVARAASRDETRPHLTGVLVTASGTELRMVATDSYRLGVKETTLDAPLEGSLEANVPARTLQELARIAAAEGAEQIEMRRWRTRSIFTVGDVSCRRASSRAASRTTSSCCPRPSSTSCA